jgi:uncharacterized protein with HEPN domain
MQHDDTAYLLDMLLAARDAMAFSEGLNFSEFEQSRLHQHAVIKAIEIIGEAAARITNETKSAHPEIAWTEIIGMRNRLVHVYFDLDLERIWETVRRDLPRLIVQLEPLAPPAE